MARIRTIKPEFWTSEQVMECSPNARLLFIGIWTFCDDAGRHPWAPRRLKAQIFPGDDFSADDVLRMLDELSAVGLIEDYEVDGERYFYVTGWKHQKIDRPQKPKFPDPFSERSANGSDGTHNHKGEDIYPLIRDAPQQGSSAEQQKNDEQFEAFWRAYPKRDGDNPKKPARLKFDAAIRRGEDPAAIVAGAEALARARAGQDPKFTPQAVTWLNQERWKDAALPLNGTASHPTPPKDDRDAESRLRVGRDRQMWPSPRWGPAPGKPGCTIPAHLLKPGDGEGWTEWQT